LQPGLERISLAGDGSPAAVQGRDGTGMPDLRSYRLAVLSSHPIQYYGPLFRELAKVVDLHVLFAHRASGEDQARAGFETAFDWDVDLTSGYSHEFLANVARRPGTDHFLGCDTPGIGARLRQGQYDAVLVLGWHLKSYLQGLLAAKRLGLPVLVRGDSHLMTNRSALKRSAKVIAYPPFLRLFDAALYVGERSRAYYRHYGYPAERLFFSPHCVDTAWFAERATDEARAQLRARLGLAPTTTALLFAGRLVAFKRPLDVIAAAALCRARGQDVEVIIAGEGDQRGALIDAAAGAEVPLHMLGFRNQTEMPPAYAAADLLVLPSEGETWGLVANEALACGRPIAVSDACGCAADLARDEQAGTTFALGNIEALADRIMAMTAEPPNSDAILRLSKSYSIEAAVAGIRLAIGHLQQIER
jgi:glycosyltransferase involved in cell wall biosynthesis